VIDIARTILIYPRKVVASFYILMGSKECLQGGSRKQSGIKHFPMLSNREYNFFNIFEYSQRRPKGNCMANQEHLDILKQGVDTWNQWQKKHANILPDLSNANLKRADLSHANLNHANLNHANLSGANLSEVDLSWALLFKANLSGADLSHAVLNSATLHRTTLHRTTLSGAVLRGADLSKADLSEANLSEADLSEANLSEADLSEADLGRAILRGTDLTNINLRKANLSSADLRYADLFGAYLSWADFSGANLSGTTLFGAYLREANLTRANLSGVDARRANFFWPDIRAANPKFHSGLARHRVSWSKPTTPPSGANLSEADLSDANLSGSDLSRANLSGANLRGTNLSWANLSGANLSRADLTGCFVYATSVWDVELDETIQTNLIIRNPDKLNEPAITVDNLEVAQLIYLLLNNKKIRDVIDTVAKKAILILGRFTPKRKAILDALREELRKKNYLPIVFDFEKPASQDLTETISTLAHLARFVIADLTQAKSIPQELERIVPGLPSVPVQPLLQARAKEYGMFEHFKRYPWVLEIYRYTTADRLLASLQTMVIEPAEQKAQELEKR
jgi:uncharacterized protein YjbI with pentapeptide repeats